MFLCEKINSIMKSFWGENPISRRNSIVRKLDFFSWCCLAELLHQRSESEKNTAHQITFQNRTKQIQRGKMVGSRNSQVGPASLSAIFDWNISSDCSAAGLLMDVKEVRSLLSCGQRDVPFCWLQAFDLRVTHWWRRYQEFKQSKIWPISNQDSTACLKVGTQATWST